MEEGSFKQAITQPIPKFASFRSQVPITNKNLIGFKDRNSLNDQSSKSQHQSQTQDSDNHSDAGHGKHRKHQSSRGESHWKKREEVSRSRQTQNTVAVGYWEDVPETFVIDKRGDPANLTYGRLHRYQVPSYRRSGSGSVIGISSRHKIQRDKSNDETLILYGDLQGQPIRRDKNVFEKILRDSSKEVSIRQDSSVFQTEGHNVDYVPFGSSRSKRRKRGDQGGSDASETSTSADESSVNYRSIEGKAKPTEDPEDFDLQKTVRISGTDNNRWLESDGILRREVAALSRKVDIEPANGQLWIDLINYQDRLLGIERHSRTTKAERSSTAEIKLSMYDKALTKVTDWQTRECLILGMMDEASKFWETSKLAAKWWKVLRAYPGYVSLWVKYLDFQQTTFSTFQYERFQDVCQECLQVVKNAKLLTDISTTLEAHYHEIQAYLLVRLTLSMRESGYSEHAIAIWQSVLEFNLFRPHQYMESGEQGERSSNPLMLKSFEDYWESEAPRIGEKNSRGWNYFDTNAGLPLELEKDSLPAVLKYMQTLEPWEEAERSQALQARKPARTTDDVEDNDPYKVIMFSDIQPFLIEFSSDARLILIHAFLAFCHLPPPLILTNSPRHWWRDAFIRNEALRPLEGHLRNWNISKSTSHATDVTTYHDFRDTLSTDSNIKTGIEFPMFDFLTSSDSLFTKDWYSSFNAWTSECGDNAGPVEIGYVSRILRSLVNAEGVSDELAEFLIAFEFQLTPKVARKTAKTLLKKRASSLRLYNAYAILEYRLGKIAVANSVMATTINMSRTLNDNSQRDVILLWKTWVWEVMEYESYQQAFQLLLTLPDSEISPIVNSVCETEIKTSNRTAVLRTQRTLSDGRDSMISLGHYYHASIYIECLVLLAYLDSELSLEAAFTNFASNMALILPRLLPTSTIQEHLHQFRTTLLNYHINHVRSCKPGLIRSALSESIQLFPQNTMFLSFYAWNESRFRIDDRVRSIMQDVVLSDAPSRNHASPESVVSHFFAVYVELNRGLTLGSNVHAIRSTFERAVESSVGNQSAALWKLFFLFEHSRHEEQRAKGVFYRAIAACPWAKELYMLAFRYLGGILRIEELKGIYEAMVEKRLRVHASLDDDVWEKLGARDVGSSSLRLRA